MGLLIEDTFRKVSDQKYIIVNRQIGFAIMGGIGLSIFCIFLLPTIWRFFSEGAIIEGVMGVVGFIIFGGMMLLFVAMGLLTTTTEIDLSTRKVRITKRNIRGAQATSEASLDDLCISAARMGRTTAASRGSWLVRAGFMSEGENGEDNSVAIWSKEVADEDNIKERNKIMFELYRFFFPDRPPVSEANIVTNGNVVMLLSEEEKTEFEKKSNEPDLFEIHTDEQQRSQGSDRGTSP